MQPSEDDRENETLPRLELDSGSGEALAADVRAEFDELTDTLRRGDAEEERKFGIVAIGAREVVDLALAGKAIPLAGGSAAGENIIDISASEINMGRRWGS
jgi:hypothetical protein